METKPMSEHERYKNEMNTAFELLENLIRELPITIPRQDLLSEHARQLMESAYQAGKSEVAQKSKKRKDV
jgi:hypothetical protein